jgi:hypothetical protein
MLIGVRGLFGWSIGAVDGDIGHVGDVYFDDRRWAVCYVVVDTGPWLVGRSVLVSPQSVDRVDRARQKLRTDLTRRQVALSPDVDSVKPVSRQHELELCHCYGFPSYAVTTAASVSLTSSGLAPSAVTGRVPHLRSARAITGYYVHALDGEVGHAEDFLVDEESWALRHLVVSVGTWWPGRKVLVPAGWIAAISWGAGAVAVSLPAEVVRLAPDYDPAVRITPAYEARLSGYYGPAPFTST